VAAPAQRAALISSDVIAACFTAFEGVELGKPVMPDQFIHYQFQGPPITSDERRVMYQNWLLGKGFQDLARGIRETLEEATLYLHLIAKTGVPIQLQQLAKVRKHAASLRFPSLMAKVNAKLVEPMAFEAEFLSIQKVRNCLEHRAGVVGTQDLDEGDTALSLNFPRRKVFYLRGGEEIEIAPNEPVNAGDGKPDVQLLVRIVTRTQKYRLGEQIIFTSSQFSEIAAACHHFATDLASKLPTVS